MSPTSLHHERLLITGGHGFLGKHLCTLLQKNGLSSINPTKQECDYRDWEQTKAFFQNQKPTLVFHLAAVVGGIGANQKMPATLIRENALMAIHVYEASRFSGVKKIISMGSVCSYGEETPLPFSEKNLWTGYPDEVNAPYGIAKRLLSVLGDAYQKEHQIESHTLISANLYGPGDHCDPETSHVIPAMIRKITLAKKHRSPGIVFWGTGEATRDFLYIEDAAHALLQLAQTPKAPPLMNMGSGHEISMKELAGMIAGLCDYAGSIQWDSSKPDGSKKRRLDLSLAEKTTGSSPKTTLEEGLKKTIVWYLTQ